MNSALLKVVFSSLVKVATAPLRILPIKKNRILFTGLTGGKVYDYSCNPKYLYEYMRDHFPGQFEYVWAVSDKEKFSFLEEEGVRLIKHFTVSSFPVLLTSKVIVTNGSYAPWFPFRKKQYVVNTWHGGGAYKKVENERPDADWATKKRAEFCAKNMNLFLASCKVQEEQMIRTTYQYEGEVFRAGTPRNDLLVQGNSEELAGRVREKFHIPENGRIVLYAPTYRKTGTPVVLDGDALVEALNKAGWNGRGTSQENIQWFFFSRYHRYQDDQMEIRVEGTGIIDVMEYPDMQELLAAADLLITDYSSCVWDYAVLKRPCVLYVPDKEEYVANTGFYVSVDEWPFPQTRDMDGLIDEILHYDKAESDEKISGHLKQLGSYESGSCCRQLAERIQLECE